MTSISRSAIYYGTYESIYSLGSINEEKQFIDYFKNRFCRFYREGEIKNEDSVLGVDIVSVIYNFLTDMKYLESVARRNLNLIKENEVVYRFNTEPSKTPEQTESPKRSAEKNGGT